MPHPLRAAALAAAAATFGFGACAGAQDAPKAPAAVTLGAPAMSPPLALNADPISVDGGPFGRIYVSGQLSGLGLAQTAKVPFPGSGDADALGDVGNAMVAVQTISGPLQIFIQAGAYSFPTLGTPYLRAGRNLDAYFSAVPVAYGKVVLSPEVSIQAGAMPTVIGSEYAFTFQNTNIERGLLWNQEPVISKGVQLNYAHGPLTLQTSLNDGFSSDHYTWFSGLLSYALDAHSTVGVNGGFNFAHTFTDKFRAPNTLNNSGLFLASYTYSNGPVWISPYFQYTTVPADVRTGVTRGAETYGGAVLANYTFTPSVSLGGRVEYIASRSDRCRRVDGPLCAPTSLLYGPGSDALSVTATPTWRKGIVFVRGELSYVRIDHLTPGFGFGSAMTDRDQVRGLVEAGILF